MDSVRRFAEEIGAEILAEIPYDERFAEAEKRGIPLSVMAPRSRTAQKFRALCDEIFRKKGTIPKPMDDESWERFLEETR